MNETTQLLLRWRDGDKSALAQLLSDHLSFVRERARKLLGPALREKLTSEDVAQDAAVEFLSYGPKFVPENGNQLRALLARIVANSVADSGNWFQAQRRRMSREKTLETAFDPTGQSSVHDPAKRAAHAEMSDRLRLAIELLSERDRQLIVWREFDKLAYQEIGERIDKDAEAARAACRRAVQKLRQMMARIRQGGLNDVLDEGGEAAG